jgi:hypothetical protein
VATERPRGRRTDEVREKFLARHGSDCFEYLVDLAVVRSTGFVVTLRRYSTKHRLVAPDPFSFSIFDTAALQRQ